MSKRRIQDKEGLQIFGVFVWMMLGGICCLMAALVVRLNPDSGFEGKTLWDWLDLFLLPCILIVCILLAYFISWRSQKQRVLLEQTIAHDNQCEALMNAYIELITGLLLRDDSELVEGENGNKAKEIARAHSLDIFRRLDGARKGMVLRFLFDSKLLFQDENAIKLRGADLSGIQLQEADLRRINLCGTHMMGANLVAAKLSGSILRDIDLHEANLSDAELIECDLEGTKLFGVDLRGAMLARANLKMAELEKSNLRQAFLEGVDLQGAKCCSSDLRGAYLMDANMQRAIFRNADLSGAYLDGADLSESDLTYADLTDAVLNRTILVGSKVNEHQLATARSIEGAILPQGNLK